MPRLGVFGGAFDPPHMGHITVAAHALAVGRLDKLLIVPCWKHSFNKKMSPFIDRLQMCYDTFQPVFGNRVEVLLAESVWKTKYTVDMIGHLQHSRHVSLATDQIVFIVGADEFENLDRWHQSEDLRKMVEFFKVRRGIGAGPQQFTVPDVNSSFIRNQIALQGSTDGLEELIASGVEKYIRKNGLYLEKV